MPTRYELHNCIICSKPKDNSFYDKSIYRPICSKQCYSVYYDNLDTLNRITKKDFNKSITKVVNKSGIFYKQGKVTLQGFIL